MFSTNEYDIGNFNAIEHCIDTGDSRPIKNRLRRKPGCFAGGEEKHLEKMINADVIEPSISEWASSPVLICKRDRSVRWCVYYLALKIVTKMMYFRFHWWRSVYIHSRAIFNSPNLMQVNDIGR